MLLPICYGAGLTTGLLHFWAPACAVLLPLAWTVRRRPDLLLATGSFAIALVAAGVALAGDRAGCTARLLDGRVITRVRLSDAAVGRGLVRARLPDAKCRGPISVRWPEGESAGAGTVARVQGRWISRGGRAGPADGLLVVFRADSLTASPTPAEQMRNAVTAAARRLYGGRAPLVDALVLGTRGGLDPAIRDQFAYSGLVHLLSISGFHVGLVSAWVVLLLRLAGMGRVGALAIGATVGVAYVAFLGWPAPGTRAAALAALLALLFHRQRRVDPDALLGQTCLLVLLIDPWSIFDLGGWLSAAALWGATTATRWSDRRIGGGFLARTLASSVGATLATAPITAALLGAVATVGIALNLVAIPLAALAVPGVIASLLIEPLWHGLAAALAAGSGAVLNALELLAKGGAAMPGGHVVLAAEPRSALPWLAALAAGVWAIGRGNTKAEAMRRTLLAVAAWIWLALVSDLRPATGVGHAGLALHFLDVGQGDGAAIRTPGGRWIIVDAGPRSGGWDAGRRVIAPFLARHGVRRLEAIVISHAHLDHLGGAEALLDRFDTGIVFEPADQVPDPLYAAFLDAVIAAGVRWRPARAGAAFEIDGVRFAVLHPDTSWREWGADVNEDSIVLRVEFGGFSALFAGDAGLVAESRLRGQAGAADVLKVGHHGSRTATGDRWLAELKPRVAVVSVGRNRYGHPSPDALARLARQGVAVWRTDRDGAVSITTDGRTMTVHARRGTTTYPVQ